MTTEAGCTVAQSSSEVPAIFSGGLTQLGCTYQVQASVGTSALGADRSQGVSQSEEDSASRMQEEKWQTGKDQLATKEFL